ncbi:MAG: BBP7 family outer membrane beta-barrel protein [Planctomycetaceae bacterium]|nr:BBP7 family outer membrane beta-barrel protein [Planctomycetaceae bacterium]
MAGSRIMHELHNALFQSSDVDWRTEMRSSRIFGKLVIATVAFFLLSNAAEAQIRVKTPDRDVYQPPLVPARSARPVAESEVSLQPAPGIADYLRGQHSEIAELVRTSEPEPEHVDRFLPPVKSPEDHRFADKAKRLRLMEVTVETKTGSSTSTQKSNDVKRVSQRRHLSRPVSQGNTARSSAQESMQGYEGASQGLQRVQHEEVILVQPTVPKLVDSPAVTAIEPAVRLRSRTQVLHHDSQHDEKMIGTGELIQLGEVEMHSLDCDGCSTCPGDCDSLGCDSLGCPTSPWYRRWSNSGLSFRRDRWFGNAELLLLWRRGDLPPPLVTTGPGDDPNTAGELGQPGTEVLFPSSSLHRDMSVGGRVTLGTWLDGRQYRSLVLRGWLAGEETASFNADQTTVPVITRPFFNVTDGITPTQDTQTIAFPARAEGSIGVRASSEVYGADVSVRQFMYGKYGATVDFLYGYQFMRLDENLHISSDSVSLDADVAPVGSTFAIDDNFDIENEFHGAQFGLATRYRERCWSFNALAKVAFGSLARRSTLTGSTFATNGPSESTAPEGLLVQDTNSGTFTDHTFGWIPEIDLSIGWQRWPCWEATFGYNIIAMTDAVRASGLIDPELAVNLADPITGQASPRLETRDSTFYLRGIHFGMQYVY